MNIINTATTIITNITNTTNTIITNTVGTVGNVGTLIRSSSFFSSPDTDTEMVPMTSEIIISNNNSDEPTEVNKAVEDKAEEDDKTDEDTDENDSFNMSVFLEKHPKKLKNVFPEDKCPVCLEKFNADDIIRTLLDCGHFVCIDCMNSSIIPAGSSRHKCPLCREKGGFFDGDKYVCRATTIGRSHSTSFAFDHFDPHSDMAFLPPPTLLGSLAEEELTNSHNFVSSENRIIESGELDPDLTVFTETEVLIEELNHSLHLSTRNMDFFNIESFLEDLYPENISFIRKLQNTMSIVFCLDATGSMNPFIDACKNNISNMVKEFLEKNPEFIMNVYINVFYDFDLQIVHKVFKCTATLENTTSIDTFLSNIHPQGGGDEAEDINTSLYIATGGIQTNTTIGPQTPIKIRGNSLLVISTDAYHKGFLQHMSEEERSNYSSGLSDNFKMAHPHGLHFVDLLQKINTTYKQVVVFKLNERRHHGHMIELIHKHVPSSKEINMSQIRHSDSDYSSDRLDGIIFRTAAFSAESSAVPRNFSDGVGTVLRSITRSASCTY